MKPMLAFIHQEEVMIDDRAGIVILIKILTEFIIPLLDASAPYLSPQIKRPG